MADVERRLGDLEEKLSNFENKALDKKDYELLLLRIETLNAANAGILSKMTSIETDLKIMNGYINRWKGASFLLLGLGSLATLVFNWVLNFIFSFNVPPTHH